jgi:hypothetical protein
MAYPYGAFLHSKKIFRMQKRIARIMLGYRKLASCKNLFQKLKILPLMSQYIFSITLLIIKNKHQFTINSEIHNLNLHKPAQNQTGFKQHIYYSGVKIYNNFPPHIKQL